MKKRILRYLLYAAIVGLLTGAGTIYYVFNKPHRNVAKEKPAYIMQAKELFADFSKDEYNGNLKYGDKVIQVSGAIAEISKNGNDITLVLDDVMEGVSCALDSVAVMNNRTLVDQLSIGDNVVLKGKCDGIDMIMGVVLTRCFLILENN